MRIHRIHLQHVAGVDDRALDFGDGVTVVVGPNEAGKSTIATALQLLLEEKDRYDNERIRAIRPVHVDADPTIELECTTGPYHLTYRKVFGATAKRRETSLTIHAPTPASLTGDDAHDRMCEILDETVDEQLWSALRVQQRHDVGQADLTESGALAAALDAAGSGAATLSDDGSIVARVEEEAAEYWTDTGKERKPLKVADERVAAARTALDEATAARDGVRDATERHDRLVTQLETWRDDLPGLERRAKETAEALADVDALREAARSTADRVRTATDAATRARDAVTDRELLAERVTTLTALVDDQDRAVTDAQAAAAGAIEAAEEARAERDDARRVLDASEGALRVAEADVRLLRLESDIDAFGGRIARAEELHAAREQAKAGLDDGAPTSADIRRLESLAEEVRTTAAVLAADLPRLHVAGPEGTAVTIADQVHTLDGAAVQQPVDREIVVSIGEVTVTVVPGTSATELADSHADADHDLRTALAAAGVTDVAAARTRRDAAIAARQALEATDGEWQRLTAVDGLDGLRASLRRTETAADDLRDRRPEDRPLPDDVHHAEELVAAAQSAVDQARADLSTAQTALETATATASTLRTAAAEAVARRDGAREQLTEATTRLAAARDEVSDDDLAAAAQAARSDVDAATAAHEAATAAVDALDVTTIEADASAAQARLTTTRTRIQEADLERARLWGEVEASAAAGLGEKVPQLAAALTDAEDDRDALRHRAEALRLLRETLHRHRDAARSRYQAPLKAAIERLGRVVFGDDFRVELDETLRIVRRTSSGRTLDLEQLSGGAQEQLAIISRLAAASLVDADDGVPLILDDALGYADPTRTDRVNTLLSDVGQHSQVIVLTCDPDRFAGVAGARLQHVA